MTGAWGGLGAGGWWLGCRLGRPVGCSSALGVWLRLQRPGFLGTYPPIATWALIALYYHSVLFNYWYLYCNKKISYAHNLGRCDLKASNKIRPELDLNPWPLPMEGEEHKWIIRNFICLNSREWYEDMIDHCSYAHSLSSCEIKAWKKIRPDWDLNPWPLSYRCSTLPTELSSQLGAGHCTNWPLCAFLSRSIISSYHSLQFKYINFHIFIWKKIS